MRPRLLLALLCTLLCLGPSSARGEPRIGQVAPWFDLETLAGGRVSRRALAGQAVVLVVGRTQKAAPPCKEWVLTLGRRVGAPVYQVIVIDKPWYLPRGAVLSKIKGFTGGTQSHRVLLEWYAVFAEAYGIPRDDDPRVVVIDGAGVIRQVLRGALTPGRLAEAVQGVQTLLPARSAR